MAFAALSGLPLGRAHCGICVRVVRLWEYFGNKEGQLPLHVDMVLVDDKGNRMYAEIPGAEADKFKASICEGGIYVFRKFVVSPCKAAYKPFESEQMIRFTPWTTVEGRSEMEEKLPKYTFDLIDFQEFPSRVGRVDCFIDTIGMIVGVSEVVHVHLPSSQCSTAKRVIALKDLRQNQINLVLWGSKATEFDAETVHSVGQECPVVAIFVGMLLKSYKAENTLSGGSACKWYINEEIPEIETFFDRMHDAPAKIDWISAGEQKFRSLEQQANLEEKTVMELRDMDPWEFEGAGYRCTVTITRVSEKQPWWFSSCTKCHRASAPSGDRYKCSGGCPCTTAEPKYRLSLIGTDGTATAEFTLFGRVASQIVGKPVISLIRSASKTQYSSSDADFQHMIPELASLVSQKFTFSVSINQKNLTHRNVAFQVNSIVTFFGKQNYIPKPADLHPDRSKDCSVVISSGTDDCGNVSAKAPQKKARLERRIIPCRRNLDFSKHISDQDGGASEDRLGETERALTPEKINETLQDTHNKQASTGTGIGCSAVRTSTSTLPCSAEKLDDADHGAVKQRSGGGRKRGVCQER